MRKTTWFCVDIECSGPVPALYDMVSLGAVVVSSELELGETFYVEIRPTAPRVDPNAMKVNGLDLEALRRDGRPMRDALAALSDFVARQRAPGSNVVFVGHNAPFDWSFVSYNYHAEGLENPFGYKALDTKALAMGVLGLPWAETHKENLELLLSLPPQDAARTHRADYDAWYQAHILVGLLRRMLPPPRVPSPR